MLSARASTPLLVVFIDLTRFTAQALRTVHDHWYQETWQVGDKPYFRSVAEAFLETAQISMIRQPRHCAD